MKPRRSRYPLVALVAGGLLLLTTAPSGAQSPAEPAVATPVAAVEAFHQALAAGDRDAALNLLEHNLIVFEAGRAEMSRTEYAAGHLAADMEFSGSTRRQVLDQRSGASGGYAWVFTRYATTGTFRGRPVDGIGVETMILSRQDGIWRIQHIHWSSVGSG